MFKEIHLKFFFMLQKKPWKRADYLNSPIGKNNQLMNYYSSHIHHYYIAFSFVDDKQLYPLPFPPPGPALLPKSPSHALRKYKGRGVRVPPPSTCLAQAPAHFQPSVMFVFIGKSIYHNRFICRGREGKPLKEPEPPQRTRSELGQIFFIYNTL